MPVYFAELDATDTVIRVLAVPDDQAHRGAEFLSADLGLGGEWVQTDREEKFRRRFTGPGQTYDRGRDAFLHPKPYPSWKLDEKTLDWEAPVKYPSAPGEWTWNEKEQQWDRVQP